MQKHIQVVLEEYKNMSRNIHILFYEQAVCRRDTKMEKVLPDDGK